MSVTDGDAIRLLMTAPEAICVSSPRERRLWVFHRFVLRALAEGRRAFRYTFIVKQALV